MRDPVLAHQESGQQVVGKILMESPQRFLIGPQGAAGVAGTVDQDVQGPGLFFNFPEQIPDQRFGIQIFLKEFKILLASQLFFGGRPMPPGAGDSEDPVARLQKKLGQSQAETRPVTGNQNSSIHREGCLSGCF